MKNHISPRSLRSVTKKTDLRCIHCVVLVQITTFVESTAIVPLKNCVTGFRFCLECRHFTVRREREKKVYAFMTVRRMQKVTVLSPARSLCGHNCLCDSKETLARYLPRRDIFPFFFSQTFFTTTRKQRTRISPKQQPKMLHKNDGKIYKPKLTTTKIKLKNEIQNETN